MSSLLARVLGKRQKASKSLPHCSVYLGKDSAIVAPCCASGDGGVYYEQEKPFLLKKYTVSELGAAVKESLKLFEIKERDLQNLKKSDWPSYRVSRCPSIKSFEKEFQRIRISYLNSAGASARAEIDFEGVSNQGLFTTFNPLLPDEIVGKHLVQLMSNFSLFLHVSGSVSR